MKGEWVCEKLMRNWLSFELKSLQKSVYVPCSEKMRVHFCCEQERRGGGGGGGRGCPWRRGDTWGFRERLKTPHLFSKACMSKTNMSCLCVLCSVAFIFMLCCRVKCPQRHQIINENARF